MATQAPEQEVRWNIKVSKETDLSLRTFLGARGMKKGDLSRFIEEAVRWRVFHRTVQDIKARNANTGPDDAWEDGKFTLLTLRATLRKPRVASVIQPDRAGRLVNQSRRLAAEVGPPPHVKRSPDPTDDFLLAWSEAGKADYLVTGDKGWLLSLRRHKATRIASASDFAALFR